MYDRDSNQKVKAPSIGNKIKSSDLDKMVALILKTVRGDNHSIFVERAGQSVIIKLGKGVRSGGGGGGGGDTFHIEATTKAGLTDASTVSRKTLGFVTTGGDIGMVCVVNPAGNDWNAITHLE